jgi:hypothetical protein
MAIHFLNNFTAVISTIAIQLNNTILTSAISISIIAFSIISGLYLAINILKNKKIFKLEPVEVKIKNILSNIFTQYIVIITLLLYVIITIYTEIILF